MWRGLDPAGVSRAVTWMLTLKLPSEARVSRANDDWVWDRSCEMFLTMWGKPHHRAAAGGGPGAHRQRPREKCR